MKLNCQYAEASEAGDYFQVIFQARKDNEENDDDDDDIEYLLIQRQFEFPTKYDCHIETKGYDYIGDFKIDKAILTYNSFTLKIQRKEKTEINIIFKVPRKTYNEIKRVLKIIIPQLTVNEKKIH